MPEDDPTAKVLVIDILVDSSTIALCLDEQWRHDQK